MKDLESLVKEWKEARKNERLLKQEYFKAKDAIPYAEKECDNAKFTELKNKSTKLYDEWINEAEKVLDLEQKLKELGYEFPNENSEA